MRLTPLLLPLLLPVLLAGCYAEDFPRHPERPGYVVAGSFTEAATQQDVEDLETRLRHWDAELKVRDASPMTYRITLGSGPACDEVRAMLGQRPYIAGTGRCQAIGA